MSRGGNLNAALAYVFKNGGVCNECNTLHSTHHLVFGGGSHSNEYSNSLMSGSYFRSTRSRVSLL
jgi:hypothetical protein